MEQRKHERVHVEYAASFLGGRFDAQGVILNLSVGGCRARGAVAFKKDDCLGVLIVVPRYENPLQVVRAVVRWSTVQEFGMEFMHMEQGDQRRLRELIRALKAGGSPCEQEIESP
jgi:PilZ domain